MKLNQNEDLWPNDVAKILMWILSFPPPCLNVHRLFIGWLSIIQLLLLLFLLLLLLLLLSSSSPLPLLLLLLLFVWYYVCISRKCADGCMHDNQLQ